MHTDASTAGTRFVDSAPEDRFCDLVLSGGISSGIVFPTAIAGIAQHFRLQSIGGTSVGAIAAAFAAAAEYRRRRGSFDGFAALAEVPKELQDAGPTPLLSLFQPAARTQRLFSALVWTLDHRLGGNNTLLQAVHGLARAYAIFLVSGVLLGVAFGWGIALALGWDTGPSIFAALVGLVVVGLVVTALAIYRDVVHGLVANHFGLCSGNTEVGANCPALVPWMHETIQRLAGRTADSQPLTFRDLSTVDGKPPASTVTGSQCNSIDLQIYTTSLSHGRPFRLPQVDDSCRLYFCPSELRNYFPETILKHLKDVSTPYIPSGEVDDPEHRAHYPEGLLELPKDDLPILVAARLSLSFPILFSAVPLWAIDYDAKPGRRRPHRCWFSDGGLSSNFPIHLFDSLVPEWPTFGIWLHDRSPNWDQDSDVVWLPRRHYQGQGDRWNRFGDEPKSQAQLFGFLAALFASAKDWHDNALMRMPGVRDRVVRVGLSEVEGGLLLRLPDERSRTLSKYGRIAAQALCDKFVPAHGTSEPTRGWNEHRWVRYNIVLRALRKRLAGLSASARLHGHSSPLSRQIFDAAWSAPLEGPRDRAIGEAEAAALSRALHALEEFEEALAALGDAPSYEPEPEPELRARPPL